MYTVRRYTYVYVAHLYLLSILYPNTRLVRAWGGAGWPCAQFTIWRNMAWVAHEKTRSLCTKHVFPPSVFHTSMEHWIFNPQTVSPMSINPVILLMETGNIIKHLFNVERKLPFSTPRFCGSFWWTFSILCSTVSPLPFDIQDKDGEETHLGVFRLAPGSLHRRGISWHTLEATSFVLSNLGGIEKRMNGAASYDSKYDYGHSTSFLNIPSEPPKRYKVLLSSLTFVNLSGQISIWIFDEMLREHQAHGPDLITSWTFTTGAAQLDGLWPLLEGTAPFGQLQRWHFEGCSFWWRAAIRTCTKSPKDMSDQQTWFSEGGWKTLLQEGLQDAFVRIEDPYKPIWI